MYLKEYNTFEKIKKWINIFDKRNNSLLKYLKVKEVIERCKIKKLKNIVSAEKLSNHDLSRQTTGIYISDEMLINDIMELWMWNDYNKIDNNGDINK